jgi:hypothetical protein
MEMMQKDVDYLRAHNLMDYSLLIAVEKNKDFVHVAPS